MMLLHGEQYLEIRKYPIPTTGTLVSRQRLVDVLDKGSAAIVVTGTTTTDSASGDELFYSESAVFIRGAGGFGGRARGADRGAATALHAPPEPPRAPDTVVDERTFAEQAALYRLAGDRNPLHIDPAFSAAGGFQAPILHGLCFFGMAAKHVAQHYGRVRSVKARFAGVVLPGQTLRTEMWKEGAGAGAARRPRVIFQMRVVETGKLCIAGAAAELDQPVSKL
jgi:multifunctional beta-oxidation protein